MTRLDAWRGRRRPLRRLEDDGAEQDGAPGHDGVQPADQRAPPERIPERRIGEHARPGAQATRRRYHRDVRQIWHDGAEHEPTDPASATDTDTRPRRRARRSSRRDPRCRMTIRRATGSLGSGWLNVQARTALRYGARKPASIDRFRHIRRRSTRRRDAMFSHVMVGASDLDASRKFYDAVLGTLGIPAAVTRREGTPLLHVADGVLRRHDADQRRSGHRRQRRDGRVRRRGSGHRGRLARGRASPTAGRPARILRASAKAAWGRCISPICGIRPATSSAPCTAWAERPSIPLVACATSADPPLPSVPGSGAGRRREVVGGTERRFRTGTSPFDAEARCPDAAPARPHARAVSPVLRESPYPVGAPLFSLPANTCGITC